MTSPAPTAINRCIANWTESQQEIAFALRNIVLNASPAVEEKLSYGIPFYYCLGPLCYITPNKEFDGAVVLGFTKGAQLSNESGLLVSTDRKLIRHLIFRSVSEVQAASINPIVQEALLLNEWKSGQTKSKKR